MPYARHAWVRWTAAIAVTALLSIVALLPMLRQIARQSSRVPDAENLRDIGTAIAMYANDHDDIAPPTLETLVPTYLRSSALRVDKPTDERFAVYVYAPPPGPSREWTATDVVAFDWLENHEGDGFSALFGDGHVEWVLRDDALNIVARHGAGVRPIRLSTPTTEAVP